MPTPATLTVVKCGGSADIAHEGLCDDVSALRAGGERVVLVHGGGADIDRLAGQLGVPNRPVVSPEGLASRRTDARMLDVLLLALAGRAKPRLLLALAAAGVSGIGLTGLDAGLLRAVRKPARRSVQNGRTTVIRDDLSGRVTSVRAEVLSALLAADLVPVISPPALGVDGAPLNVDADRVASAVAVALGADRLVLLTAAAGLLDDPTDPASLVTRCAVPATGPVHPGAVGGMHRKLIAAREALVGGVPAVRIADGRLNRPLWSAVRGAGTALVLS